MDYWDETQPAERKKRSSSGSGVSRAKMFLQSEFGWLSGYPVRVRSGIVDWISIPRDGGKEPETYELDRDHLHWAQYTRSKLLNRFPRALPKIVGDVHWWNEGTERILEWMKASIHEGSPFPKPLYEETHHYSRHSVEFARKLIQQHPAVRPFVEALSWVYYLQPDDFLTGLEWVKENHASIVLMIRNLEGADRLTLPLVLCELNRRDGEKSVQGIVRLLSDERVYSIASSGEKQYLEELEAAFKKSLKKKVLENLPERPSLEISDQMVLFSQWLLSQDRGTRRRAVDLFNLMFEDRVMDDSEAWWSHCNELIEKMSKYVKVHQPLTSRSRDARRALTSVNRNIGHLQRTIPPSMHIGIVVDTIQYISVSAKKNLQKAVLACLDLLPVRQKKSRPRCAFQNYLVHLERYHYGDRVVLFLREFRQYLRKGQARSQTLVPWREITRQWETNPEGCRWNLTEYILENKKNHKEWGHCFDSLLLCSEVSDGFEYQQGQFVCRLARHLSDPEIIRDYYAAVRSTEVDDWYFYGNAILRASALSRNGNEFAKLLEVFEKFYEDADSLDGQLAVMDAQLSQQGWAGLIREIALNHELADTNLILQYLTMMNSDSEMLPPPEAAPNPVVPDWAEACPKELQEPLAFLNSIHPDAEKTAMRILHKVFPDHHQLEKEIQALNEKIKHDPGNERIAIRLEKLRQKQEGGIVPDEKQVRKTKERIERAIRKAILVVWQETLESRLDSTVLAVLETREDVPFLRNLRHLKAFSHALTLKKRSRTLALDLYRMRCGPPPWDLRNHKANQEFISRMETKGVNMEPWLEYPTPWNWETRSGTACTVRFEQDPLEIFQMGAPFDTCLSPGNFNYFSAFSNAADINKKVLFVRDDQDKVIARCLMAITDLGSLLVFHPYCQEGRSGFGNYVRETAVKLARRMNTVVATEGKVSCLVSSDWYDDGAIDVSNQFECLQEGSTFRMDIQELDLNEFRTTVETAFHPVPINGLILTFLIQLPEFDDRPELIRPLVRDLDEAEGINFDTWSRIIRLLRDAGDDHNAIRVIRRYFLPLYMKRARRSRWCNMEDAEVIAELLPTAAIRLIRQSRDKNVRQDEDEVDNDRKKVLAIAFEKLGRTRKAELFKTSSEE